ncbi:MAG TPA: DUF3014 domain-containing protein [Casimicrobiaceae bacterium]|nr:DUF3014 domain-containing protein [Casimicrobiaceae bacterium]
MEHVEPLDREPDFERPIDPRRKSSPARRFGWPLLMIAAVALAGYLLWRGTRAPEPAPVASAPPATVPSEPATAPSPGTPRYPIESVTPQAAMEKPLPDVADSDPSLQDVLASLFAGAPLDRIFHMEQIVPRFVATIDNLPRQTVSLSRMAVKPIGGSVDTTQTDGRILLRADNATRYQPYLTVMEQVDTQKLVQAYVRYYPLFQKAYRELGYPNGYFNDRLVEVIDHLLAAPDVPAPIALVQPKVLYEFADPALENRSAGQKMLMRMGPVNEARVKTKLRDVRRALTGAHPPR